MTGSIVCAALTTLLFATSAVDSRSTTSLAANGTDVSARLDVHSSGDIAVPQNKGRFKVKGENCLFDPNDSGPNQCTPATRGRFKKSGDDCAWDANDDGPDQCTPPKGRWKSVQGKCVWDPKDSGPHQCNPRQARKSTR